MILWDLHGEDEFQEVRPAYLRGMSGYLLVVDGCRLNSLEVAKKLRQRVEENVGNVPFVLLLNKNDLRPEWEIDNKAISMLENDGFKIIETSAKTGSAVDEAFEYLANAMLGN